MQKWLLFLLTLWFFGMLWGSSYEEQDFESYNRYSTVMRSGETDMTPRNTFNYLFDFTNSEKETTVGSVFWKLAQPDYYLAWFGVATCDFSFLKDVNTTTGETSETIASYLFKIIGIVGILCLILMFVDVIQGFIPNTS